MTTKITKAQAKSYYYRAVLTADKTWYDDIRKYGKDKAVEIHMAKCQKAWDKWGPIVEGIPAWS